MKSSCHVLLLAVCCSLVAGVSSCGFGADVSTTSTTTPQGAWTDVQTEGGTPSGRAWHAVAYDSFTREVILFGGRLGTADLGDTWSYDPSTNRWTRLWPGGPAPSARIGHSMVYDSATGRVILFGGLDAADGCLDDTWAYDPGANAWTRLHPGGETPSPRYGHVMTYEPVSDRIILFGGLDDTTGCLDDTWAYDPKTNTWTELKPEGDLPAARYGHAMTYEAVDGRVIVHDGCDHGGSIFDDTWAYDPRSNAWTKLDTAGGAPPARDWHSMVFDLAGDRVILFGGWDGEKVLDDTWAYYPATNAWIELHPEGGAPPARDLHCLVYDLSGGKVFLLGGYDGFTHFADTWAYRGRL